MKILVFLAGAALLAVVAIFYFGQGELHLETKATPPAKAAPTGDFTAVSALLQQDMNSIPTALDAPRLAPANAFSVKSRLEGATVAHPEYQTLAQVCDLIIYADKEHSVRQMQAQQAEQGVSHDALATNAANQLTMSATRTTLHARAQADWDAYRLQTDAEVHRLLASLQNVRL